jgi:Flp pilus assembly protein TadG
MRRAVRRDEGASAVEFALIAPLLIMLVVGVFEFGLNWYRTQNLASAAREGARMASVSATQAEIFDRVVDAQNVFDPADIQVNFLDVGNVALTTDPPCQGRFGQEIKVEVVVPASAGYGLSIPFWGLSNLEFRHAGVFRCEKN